MMDDPIDLITKKLQRWDLSKMSPRDPCYVQTLEEVNHELLTTLHFLLKKYVSLREQQLEEVKIKMEFEAGC